MATTQNGIHTIEVCFTPKLFSEILTKENYVVVLVDILRATTSICAAFSNGVSRIIPVGDMEEAREYKNKGYLVASEQDGKKLDFADFGNSAFSFTKERISGQTLVYCTTNGTKALDIARSADQIVIGAFINLSALTEWIRNRKANVVILCSGWKNKFCLEDTLFAGALASSLIERSDFTSNCDSAMASIDLWNLAKTDVLGYIEKAAHRHRLKRLGLDDVIPFSFTQDLTDVVPVFDGKEIRINNETYEKN
jgi:2-phosphosulfolactate phosphatase